MKPTIFHLALSVIASTKNDEWDGYAIELTKTVLERLQSAGELNEEKLKHYFFGAHPDEVQELVNGSEIANTFEVGNQPRMLLNALVQAREKMKDVMKAATEKN